MLRVYRANGELSLEWTMPRDVERDALGFAVLHTIAKRYTIPRCCITLVWARGRRSDEDVVEVQLVVSALTEKDRDLWNGELGKTSPRCGICYDPCVDADDSFAPRSGTDNCVECTACWLCMSCSVWGPSGRLCIGCVPDHPEFMKGLPQRVLQRMQLVGVHEEFMKDRRPPDAIRLVRRTEIQIRLRP